jgi:hypothetical protein
VQLGSWGRLAAIVAVSFPTLVLFCLATIWLLRLLQGMLGRSIR